MLTTDWITEHADSFDVMHIHFGFDAISPEDLGEVVGALRRHDKPLVLTVHDLRNPHHASEALHDRSAITIRIKLATLHRFPRRQSPQMVT